MAQFSMAALLQDCLEWLQHCSCAKNSRCKSQRVPLIMVFLIMVFLAPLTLSSIVHFQGCHLGPEARDLPSYCETKDK